MARLVYGGEAFVGHQKTYRTLHGVEFVSNELAYQFAFIGGCAHQSDIGVVAIEVAPFEFFRNSFIGAEIHHVQRTA